ncbi:Glucanosyltransferase-domain-containing protein [Coniochaeta sp. 2T2.1]|nr:Glucanosyltransferase-domain-containing protein [Coniochaeta sp. 2T2.1]
MKTVAFVSALAAVSGLVSATPTKTTAQKPNKRAELPTVTASGNAFWAGKERFYIRGVDYQPGGSSGNLDPLADEEVCKRDIAKFSKLGINTIRVYMTDNSKDHDVCMTALADAGIYVILDANNPLYSLHRYDAKPSYNSAYLQSVFATIDAFAKYTNTLAFFSGNEVINEFANSTLSAPYVKAVDRDMRAYIKARKYRAIPVGYSAADVSQNRMQMAAYMNCGPDEERSDFFAFNDYSWCSTDIKTSGWDQKVKNFTGYGLPIFLSEYGCITLARDFGEVGALMSSDMTSVYSGGLMYEYTMEENGYGIVEIDGTTAKELPEFSKFQAAMKKFPAPTGPGGAVATTKAQECPSKDPDWLVDSTALPAMPVAAKKYFDNGAGTGPGLSGDGSQAGAGSSPDDTSAGDAPETSGTGSTSSPSSSQNAAGATFGGPMDKAPFVVTGVACFFALAGTLLL